MGTHKRLFFWWWKVIKNWRGTLSADSHAASPTSYCWSLHFVFFVSLTFNSIQLIAPYNHINIFFEPQSVSYSVTDDVSVNLLEYKPAWGLIIARKTQDQFDLLEFKTNKKQHKFLHFFNSKTTEKLVQMLYYEICNFKILQIRVIWSIIKKLKKKKKI